jgi:hypothetical protein
LILFAAAHDEATNANFAVASRLRTDGDTFLGADGATRENLREALQLSHEPLFAMTHGYVDKLWAQGKEVNPPALAIDDAPGLAALGGRSVFAHACRTAMELGKRASTHGTYWWGYQIPVSAPSDHPMALPVFVEIFSFIKEAFAAARTEREQDQFFATLFERCDTAHDLLESIDGTDVPVSFDSFQLLVQLRLDLVVWSPGAIEPRRNPQAGHNRPTFL